MKLSDIRQLSRALHDTPQASDQQSVQEWLRNMGYDPNNLYQELEMESRHVDTHRDTTWASAIINLHSHTFYEILCCCNSCGAEYLVGTERYRLQQGDIVIVPPGVSHRPLLPERMTEPYKRDVLWISQEFVDDLSRIFPSEFLNEPARPRLLRTAGTHWEYLGEMFRSGVRESEERRLGWDAAVLGNTIQILTHLQRAFIDRHTKPLKAEKPELMDQILAYVEKYLHEKLTLAEVARHFYVSESTVAQIFRKKLGVSFYRCVTQRRLIAAKGLIAEGILLENVGTQVGFSDYSTFYRAFKQEFGISPRQYRKLQESSSPAER